MVNRFNSLILVGLILVASVSSIDTNKNRQHSSHVSGYIYNQIETYFNPEFAHVVRPFVNKFMDFNFGIIFGFSNVDLDIPFYILAEGFENYGAAWNLFWTYMDTWDSDTYANLYDVMIPINYHINIFDLGGIFCAASFYYAPDIKTWITLSGREWLYIPLFTMFGIQWFNTISLTYDTFTFGFTEHLDLKNTGYIIGKLVSLSFLFGAFIEYLTEDQVYPKFQGKIIKLV